MQMMTGVSRPVFLYGTYEEAADSFTVLVDTEEDPIRLPAVRPSADTELMGRVSVLASDQEESFYTPVKLVDESGELKILYVETTVYKKAKQDVANAFLDACLHGSVEKIKALLKNQLMTSVFRPIFLHGTYEETAESLTVLVKNGESSIHLPVWPSADPELLISVLTFGQKEDFYTQVNLINETGQSIIHVETTVYRKAKQDLANAFSDACASGSVQEIKTLLKNPLLDVNTKDEDGMTALALACTKNQAAVVEVLVNNRKTDVNTVNNKGWFPLLLACLNERVDVQVIRNLLRHPNLAVDVTTPDHYGDTALILASFRGRADVVEALCQYERTNVNAKVRGETALIRAALEDYLNGRPEHTRVVEKLLQRRDIDVNAQNEDGETALTIARRSRNKGIQNLLEKHSADSFY